MLCGYIGQHRATGPHKLIMNLHADRTAVLDGDLGHFGGADHLTPYRKKRSRIASASLPRTSLRNREPDGLTRHDQQQPEETRTRSIQRNVCVQDVSGEQQPYGLTAKPLPKLGGRGSQHFAKDSPPTVGNLIMVRSAGPSGEMASPERRPNSDRSAAIDHGVRAKRRGLPDVPRPAALP